MDDHGRVGGLETGFNTIDGEFDEGSRGGGNGSGIISGAGTSGEGICNCGVCGKGITGEGLTSEGTTGTGAPDDCVGVSSVLAVETGAKTLGGGFGKARSHVRSALSHVESSTRSCACGTGVINGPAAGCATFTSSFCGDGPAEVSL